LKTADATTQRLAEQQPGAAWPLSLRGAIAMAGSDWPRAHELLTKAVELEPKNTGALLSLARVAAAQNNAAEAEQYLKRVLAVSPTDTTARVGLAQLAASRRDFAAAEEQIEALPPSPLHDRLLGELRAVQGRFDDAATAFARLFGTA
jgi:predicted Zn-dependent protease